MPADDQTVLPTRTPLVPKLRLGHVFLIALALLGIWVLSRVLLLIFFAVLLASTLRGAADWLCAHTGMRPALSLTLIVIATFGGLGAALWAVGPALYTQLEDLATRLLAEVQRLQQHFDGAPLLQSSTSLPTIAERVITPLTQVLTFSLTSITELLVAVVTAIYFAAAPDLYVSGLTRLAPPPRRPRLRQVAESVGHVLRMWFAGQLVDMAVVGVLSAVGLTVAGVPAPLALGLLAGLFTFVPYLGTIASGALAIVIALSAGYGTALAAFVVFAVAHTVEGYIVAPLVQRRILELPPALTVLSMTVLGSLFGLPGVILGTPLAAMLLTLTQALYVGDVLGDHSVDPTRSAA